MSYANGTTHYNLPQTVGTDKRDWFDTNQPFRDIDEALWGAKESAESATSQVDAIKDRLDIVEDDMSTAKSDITTLEGEMSAVQSSVTSLGNKVDDVEQDLTDAICSVTEPTATAQHTHTLGDYFWYNDTLYRARMNINVGQQIVPNTNCDTVTVMSQIAKGSVSVTANGSKTYGTLLAELANKIDFTKVSMNSILEITSANGLGTYFHCALHEAVSQEYAANVVDFFKQQAAAYSAITIESIHINQTVPSDTFYAQITINSPVGSFTPTDRRNAVPANGVILRILY